MHRSLERQLKKTLGIASPEALELVLAQAKEWAEKADMPTELSACLLGLPELFNRVDSNYVQLDRDLELRTRSLQISSDELTQANIKLQGDIAARNRAVRALNNVVTSLVGESKVQISEGSESIQGLEFLATVIRQLVGDRELQRRKADNLIRAIDEHAIVCVLELNGKIRYANPRYCEVSGFEQADLLGAVFQPMQGGETRDEWLAELWGQLESGNTWHGDIAQLNKQGEWYWAATTIVPLLGEGGRAYEYIVISTDISRQKQTELALAAARDAADAANLAKSYFLANMSHEIRTPMNAIIGLSHLCLQTELSTKQTDYLDKIHSSAKNLLEIINDILDYSKIEAGKMSLEHSPFDLQMVLDNTVTVVSTRVVDKGLAFLLDVKADVPFQLVGDPLRLGQILVNLVGNAVKFTKQGEVVLSVRCVVLTAEMAELRFEVRDSGVGMNEEQISRLFQAFTQADSSTTRQFGGTGLGLAICKQLVGLMGGAIWVESEPNVGSKFIFTVKLALSPSYIQLDAYDAYSELAHKRILLLTPNQSAQSIFSAYLSGVVQEVHCESQPLATLTWLEQLAVCQQSFDYLILDESYLDDEGLLAALIHQRGVRYEKILLLAHLAHDELAQQIDGVLEKPFTQLSLLEALCYLGNKTQIPKIGKALSGGFRPEDVLKLAGAHVLLVEDNEINQQIAQELLEKAYVSVVVAHNGREGVELAQKEVFDGILMDMQMPVMDGLTATRLLRQQPDFNHIPIIAMTANAAIGDRDQCLAAGMNDHISKPIDPVQMLSILAKWICPRQPKNVAETLVQAPRQANEVPVSFKLAGVDVWQGVRRVGGEESYLKVLQKFVASERNFVPKFLEALTKQDFVACLRYAHTLKGLLATIGAANLSESALKLERLCQGESEDLIQIELNDLALSLSSLFQDIDLLLVKRESKECAANVAAVELDYLLLRALLQKVSEQLACFDSAVEQTLAEIERALLAYPNLLVGLEEIKNALGAYDYIHAQALLAQWMMQLESDGA